MRFDGLESEVSLRRRSAWGQRFVYLLIGMAALTPPLPAQRSTTPPSDHVLTLRVQKVLAADHVFDGMSVSTSVAGRVVTLSGTVTSDAAKVLASKDAGAVAGVKEVLNNLTVVPVVAQVVTPPTPPPPPPAPVLPRTETRQEVVPSGTPISVRITETMTSKTAKANDSFHGTVAADVMQDGFVVVPTGTSVIGRVVEAKPAGRLTGSAELSVELVSVQVNSPAGPQTLAVVTDPVSSKGKGRGANTAEKTAGGAGIGALIGGLAGGGAGAGIGALAGGGLGAGANGVTHGQEITIQSESLLRFTTSGPVTVPVVLQNGRQVLQPVPSGPVLQQRPASDAGTPAPESSAPPQ